MEEPLLADPFQLFNQKSVHHRDLAGRPAEAEKADLQPDKQRLFEADAGFTVHPIMF